MTEKELEEENGKMSKVRQQLEATGDRKGAQWADN